MWQKKYLPPLEQRLNFQNSIRFWEVFQWGCRFQRVSKCRSPCCNLIGWSPAIPDRVLGVGFGTESCLWSGQSTSTSELGRTVQSNSTLPSRIVIPGVVPLFMISKAPGRKAWKSVKGFCGVSVMISSLSISVAFFCGFGLNSGFGRGGKISKLGGLCCSPKPQGPIGGHRIRATLCVGLSLCTGAWSNILEMRCCRLVKKWMWPSHPEQFERRGSTFANDYEKHSQIFWMQLNATVHKDFWIILVECPDLLCKLAIQLDRPMLMDIWLFDGLANYMTALFSEATDIGNN